MASTTWELRIQDDLFPVRHPEDGSEFTASAFYVVAEAPDGRRFAHDHEFKSAHAYDDGECFGVASYREATLAKAETLLARMKTAQAAGKFTTPEGREHWSEIQPAYGSPAYVRAEPDIAAAERYFNNRHED